MPRLRWLLLGFWVLGCHSDQLSASHEALSATVRPRLVCPETHHDFGKVLQGDVLSHSFRVHNNGGAPLRLRRVVPSYSCQAIDSPPEIAPGVTATLRVECTTEGRSGRLRDTLHVHSNDPQRKTLALLLEAELEPTLALEPMLLEVSTDVGKPVSKSVRLVGVRAADAKLRVEAIEPPGPQVEVLPSGDGPEVLRLTLDAQSVDTLVGKVVVRTGLDRPKRLTLNYSARVAGNLTVQPTKPHFNLRDPGSKEQLIRVTSRRADLRVMAASTEGPFEARVETDSPGMQAIRVRVVDAHLDPQQRAVLGELVVFTNDPFEPTKRIPLFALGPSSKPKPQLLTRSGNDSAPPHARRAAGKENWKHDANAE